MAGMWKACWTGKPYSQRRNFLSQLNKEILAMSKPAAQSRIATSYSRKANRVYLACLIIFWLGAGLFVVSSSHADRKNENRPALIGPNATRANPGEVKSANRISTLKRWAAAPSLLASFLPPAPGDPDLVETFASDCMTP